MTRRETLLKVRRLLTEIDAALENGDVETARALRRQVVAGLDELNARPVKKWDRSGIRIRAPKKSA
jgi:hypothetical protein